MTFRDPRGAPPDLQPPPMTFAQMLHAKTKEAGPEYHDPLKQREAEQQKRLMAMCLGRRVSDLAQVIDRNGDDVYLWFYSKGVKVADGEKVIAQAVLVEQRRTQVKLEEVVHRGGTYFLAGGENYAQEIITGGYEF